MRRILLAAVLIAVAAPASAETVIWTGEVHVRSGSPTTGASSTATGAGYSETCRAFGSSSSTAAPTPSTCPTSRTRRGPCSPAPSGEVHRASCRPTPVWRGWSMGSGSSSPTTTGASPIGALRRGQLRARLAGRSGGVGAARAGADTGSGAKGGRVDDWRCAPADPAWGGLAADAGVLTR